MNMFSDSSLLRFLKDELSVPEADIALALRRCGADISLFPIVLWQYGLVTIEQLDQIFDWMATDASSLKAIRTLS
ncbi:MAG: DUF2949 domain-containing protein [Cyanobacteria bacterium J06554_6]